MQMRRPVRIADPAPQQPPDPPSVGSDSRPSSRAKGEATIGTGRDLRAGHLRLSGPGSRKGRPARRAIIHLRPATGLPAMVTDTRGDKQEAHPAFRTGRSNHRFRHGESSIARTARAMTAAVSVLPWSPLFRRQTSEETRASRHQHDFVVRIGRLPAQLGENRGGFAEPPFRSAWYRGRSRAGA